MTYSYSLLLVFLSYAIAVLGSFVALQVAIRIPKATGLPLIGWLFASGLSLGGAAIWSMHFIGMNAYTTEVPITYDAPLTVLSLVIAVLVAAVGMLIVGKSNSNPYLLILAGLAGGAGVCAMHYTGMAAGK